MILWSSFLNQGFAVWFITINEQEPEILPLHHHHHHYYNRGYLLSGNIMVWVYNITLHVKKKKKFFPQVVLDFTLLNLNIAACGLQVRNGTSAGLTSEFTCGKNVIINNALCRTVRDRDGINEEFCWPLFRVFTMFYKSQFIF